MPPVVAARQTTGPRDAKPGRRRLGLLMALLLAGSIALPALAQGIEVVGLNASRGAEAVTLDYQLRVALPRAVEEAALRGVPLYFRATATLWKPRWYWRDERVARVRREWRLAFQPLTGAWRVSQGGLGQSHATLAEALATMTQTSGWRIADVVLVEPEARHYVEFDWVLDTTQLPRPLQIGLTGVGGAGEWALDIERTVRLTEPKPEAKPDLKQDVKPEPKPDAKPEAK
jgi:hypothetical protein